MLFHPPPTEAEFRSWRAQARRHEQAARMSDRAQVQAELPRSQREVFQVKIALEGSKPPI
jgi:ferric-dicitrate binding protein FerR (iron transport regulator)